MGKMDAVDLPIGTASLTLTLTGDAPLLMQSSALADPFDERKRDIHTLTSKRQKADADLLEVARLEWEGSLYYDDAIGPYLPGQNIDAMLRDAGRLSRQGKNVERAARCLEDRLPLIYDGPRSIAALWNDKNFCDRRSVVLKRAGRVMRYRPVFRSWQLTMTLVYDDSVFNEDALRALVVTGGRFIGIGTYRPRFGRFLVS